VTIASLCRAVEFASLAHSLTHSLAHSLFLNTTVLYFVTTLTFSSHSVTQSLSHSVTQSLFFPPCLFFPFYSLPHSLTPSLSPPHALSNVYTLRCKERLPKPPMYYIVYKRVSPINRNPKVAFPHTTDAGVSRLY
jgi:hypothetical protein